jgi:cobalt-zinc-cadmium efflux system outer membrane protein
MSLRTLVRSALFALVLFEWTGAQVAAQSALSLQQAVDKALEARASLKAEAERVTIAEGVKQQAGALPNPEFQFQTENLRPGQHYGTDVDTLAYVIQPLDVLGKRGRRVDAAAQGVARTQAEYDQARWQMVRDVKLAYWDARGAQEARDLMKATVATFQQLVDYHNARLSVGAIAEQDVLRVRLEGERLNITSSLAALRAARAQAALLKAMGQSDVTELALTEPIDAGVAAPATVDQVLAQRPDMKVARAAVSEAEARARLQDVLSRPDVTVTYGYKRTQLPGTLVGANTSLAAVTVKVPLFDRNAGNRAAAAAEARRQEQLLTATQVGVVADFRAASQDYEMRRSEVVATLQPLREHADNISSIAQAAYTQGGGDLLRLLDAQRARLDAQLAWVEGMVEYQQSIVNLESAEGVAR